MKKQKSTKRALLMSALSLLLCLSMLVGTTFAWFTDSVTSGNNRIQSGNLDIELEYAVFNEDGTFKEWVDVAGKSDILTNTLWEPGVTEVAYLRIANAGSLALKYQLGINIVSETAGVNQAGNPFKLSDYIQFGVVENVNGETGAYANREAAVAAVTGAKLLNEGYTKATSMAKDEELYLALVVYMPTSVGNEANYKTSDEAANPDKYRPSIDLGINVVATQMTAENDSYGEDYDLNASYPANYVIKEIVEAVTDNNGAVVTEKAVELTAENDKSVINKVTFAVPAGAAVNASGTEVELAAKVTSAEKVQPNTMVRDNQSAIALEIEVDGLADSNDKIVTVTLDLEAGLTDLIVYHKGTAMTKLVDATTEAEGYHYDAATGILTIKSKTFSPFDVVFGIPTVKSVEELKTAIALGGNVKLGADITTGETLAITTDVVIDGNGYTLTYTGASRAMNINNGESDADLTIKNLKIYCSADYCERGISYNDSAALTLENVTISGVNVTYALNMPASSDKASVKIENTALTGNIALNVWGEDATIEANNSVFTSVDKNTVENYSAIVLNNDGTNIAEGSTININGGKIIAKDENGEPSYAIRNSTATGKTIVSENTEVIGTISIPVAIVTYEGYTQFYSCSTLQAAIDKAIETKGNVKLIADIELTEAVTVDGTVVIDLNGKNITIETAYDEAQPSANSAIVNNGSVILTGNGSVKATNNYTVRNYGTMVIDGITVENGIMNFADLTVESGNISNSRSGKHTIYGNAAKLTINGGTFHNGNPGNAAIFAYGGEVAINGGTYTIADGSATLGWTSCLLDAQGGAKYTIKGGVVNGEIRDYNNNTTIYGGTFDTDPSKYLGKNYKATNNGDGTWTVVDSREVITSANATKPVAPLEEDFLFPAGTNAVIFKDAVLSGAAQIVHTENAVLGLSNISGTLDHDVIVRKSGGAIVIEDCDFNLSNGAKLITVGEGGDGHQVFMVNVTINGVLMDNTTIWDYVEGISYISIVAEWPEVA